MAKKIYGVTLWGAKFLSAIARETDDRRLSRGKTYANTGRIYDIELNSKTILAKVLGNSSPFYNSKLSFTQFARGDIKFILKHIDSNPFMLADIMNGKLPNELLEFFDKNEIDVFSGFDMSCDCYDFYGAYACKHITALYYILTNEIDKNPFILLELRGLDLIKHYNIEDDLNVPYPLELTYTDNEKNNIKTDDVQILRLQDYKNFILSMLSEFPPFAPVDYKKVMEEFYEKVPRSLPLVVSPIRDTKIDRIQRILQDSDIQMHTIDDIAISKFKISSELFRNKNNLKLFDEYRFGFERNQLIITPTNLFNLFISFDDDYGSSSYKYLFYLFRVAYLLIENSGFIPSVVQKTEYIQIIYKALNSIEVIDKQIEILSQFSPLIVSVDNKFLDQKSGTNYIISAVLTDFVPQADFMHKRQGSHPPSISYSFFEGTEIKTDSFENKNLAYSINNYFSVFDIVKSNYKYRLFIDIEDESYKFYINIKDKNSDEEYNLNQAITKFKKLEIVKFLSYLIEFLPKLKTLIDDEYILLTQNEIEEFLLKTSSIISNLGVDIILPKELKNLLRPKLTLSAKSTSKSHGSFFTLDKMLEYQWQISIGDELLTIEEFERLVEDKKELIRFKDNFVVITPEEAKAMFAQIDKKTKLNKFDILQASLNDEVFLDVNLKYFFDDLFKPKDIEIPNTLQANLRKYQQRGFIWNINNLLNGFGSILADDMGLGKTIQTITTLLYLKENNYIENNILIVVPTSLLTNWANELDRFAPSLSYFAFYGAKRVMKKADIILTTYDLIRRDVMIFKDTKKFKIDCLIIDEAQKIKNPDTNITKAIKSLKAKYKIALSGTPVENNLSELWSIFDFTLPKYLKTLKDFSKNYAKDIEIKKDINKIEKLKKITAPFMLRRLKTDKNIISDLPDKIIIDEYTTMTKEQASLYQSVIDDTMEQLDDSRAKGVVFKLIISLKQICNHPRNFDKISDSSVSKSGKAQLLVNLLDNIILQDEKVLIFTQYTQMADILEDIIKKELLTIPLILKGSMTQKKRDEAVELFQNDNKYKIFILSLKAGGVGLNLTAANHVIHYDLWFNPAVENQATDRAFRIGQTKKVTVHRFITKNSFEEKIDKMIKAKQELSNLSVNIGENWLKDMDKDDIKELFAV